MSTQQIVDEAEQHQTRIQELETEWQALLIRMDFLVERFKDLAPGAAASWIGLEFERGIKDNAEQIQELGVAGVKIIKRDMGRLVNDLPGICHELLHERSSWAHYETELPARSNGQKEFFFDRVFRDLISTAGAVLDSHNLLENRGPHSYWQRGKEGWRYAMNPSMGPVAPDLCDEYMKGLHRLREIKRQHAFEKKGLAEARAKSLWETA
jgi:hypothetical protein